MLTKWQQEIIKVLAEAAARGQRVVIVGGIRAGRETFKTELKGYESSMVIVDEYPLLEEKPMPKEQVAQFIVHEEWHNMKEHMAKALDATAQINAALADAGTAHREWKKDRKEQWKTMRRLHHRK